MTIVRSQFADLYLEDQLPAIEALIMNRYEARPEQYSKVFRVFNTKRDIVQTTEVSGLGLFGTVDEGANLAYDAPIPAFEKTYKPVQWANGFIVSRVAFDDDRYDFISKLSGELGKSARETVETEAFNIFNNAFSASFTGPDGVALCATNHPKVGGGTQANRATVHSDLDVPSLESAFTDMYTWVDHRGRKAGIKPANVLVHPSNAFNVAEILKSNLRSDTANNAVNAFKEVNDMSTINYMISPYLTDTDAWFVLADKEDTELRFYWRERPSIFHDVHFDSRSLKTAMWMRFIVGFNGYLGVWGSAGA